MDLERARRTYESEDVIKLASNESPWGPHPAVLEAVASAAAGANRYPDQYASLLRRRIADRFEREPGGIAVSNGSCEILLAAALALCEPGAELVYAWPSFSMYPQLAPLSGAREIRVPLNDDYEHDLDAMASRDHRGDPARDRLQPEQPDRHLPAAGADRRLHGAGARVRDRDPRRGLRRDADARPSGRDGRPAAATSPTWSCCGRSARSTGSPGCAAGTPSARRSSAPRWTRCDSRSASTCSRRRRERRRSCTPTTCSPGSSGP